MVYDPNAAVPIRREFERLGDPGYAGFIVVRASYDQLRYPDKSVGEIWALNNRWGQIARPRARTNAKFHEMCQQYGFENIYHKIPLTMFERAVWLTSPERQKDMSRQALVAIRIHALNNMPMFDHPLVRHLPDDRVEMMMDAVTRPAEYTNRGTRILDADQMALMVLALRHGASRQAAVELFETPAGTGSISEAARMADYDYQFENPGARGWHWDEDERVDQNRRSTAVFAPKKRTKWGWNLDGPD